MEGLNLSDNKYYRNRELSWIQFNERVLDQATDETNPLFERMRFLSISASNLDEFTMIRVASLKDLIHAGYTGNDFAGMSPTVQLSMLSQATHDFVTKQYLVYNNYLLCKLNNTGIHVVNNISELTSEERKEAGELFENEILPVLSPVPVNNKMAFPLVRNESVYLSFLVKKEGEDEPKMILLEVPGVLKRTYDLGTGDKKIVLLEDIILDNIHKVFKDMKILAASQFRIMRNADLTIDEEDAEDLLKNIEDKIKLREWGEVIRMDCKRGIDGRILERLSGAFRITNKDTFFVDGPLDLTFLNEIYSLEGYEKDKFIPFEPDKAQWAESGDVFEAIREKDRVLFTPYESFEPVVKFIETAAHDENVLAIKQTLYRVGRSSPIVKALAEAARNGKTVTVMMELKARFDEENNIEWARLLEQAGANVIYGPVDLKTHAKITLVIRREPEGVTRYAHLGTGNYNTMTAGGYTDVSMFTADRDICEDAGKIFNLLSGISDTENFKSLVVAPMFLKSKLTELIEQEKAHALQGKPAAVTAKMNSLCDPDIIRLLYEASGAGVKINLIVRGICSLKVGVPGVSDNIKVKSVIGRFLEHSRVFKFENAGEPLFYCSSADWMPRNLERRVEIMFPVKAPDIIEKLNLLLINLLRDDCKGRELQNDGNYTSLSRGSYCYQEDYIRRKC